FEFIFMLLRIIFIFQLLKGGLRSFSRFFCFSSRRRHTRSKRDWSSDVCSSDLGLTLPGIIELPGSLAGMVISPIPERGPLDNQRTSLAIFIKSAAKALSAP